jgi:hypothetical protein
MCIKIENWKKIVGILFLVWKKLKKFSVKKVSFFGIVIFFLKHDRGTRSAQALFHVSKETLFLFHSIKITFFVYFRNIAERKVTKLLNGLLQNCAPFFQIYIEIMDL